MTDFFEAGKVYTDPTANDPYKAPEQSTVFRCEAVLAHPQTGNRIAVGWKRPGGQTDCEWQLAVVGALSWNEYGPWIEGDKWEKD